MSNYWDELMGDDAGAAQYMETYGEGPGCETRQIIAGLIHDGESVLDVGCGPGWNLDHFIEFGPSVGRYKGVDYSERFIRVANQRVAARLGVQQLVNNLLDPERLAELRGLFVVGDCRYLKDADESWDVVVLQDVLEHTNGYEKPVREALRVARKRVIVVFWRTFNENGRDDINDDGNDGYGATYDRGKWEAFLNGLGYPWVTTETSPAANRWHKYYVITKETASE